MRARTRAAGVLLGVLATACVGERGLADRSYPGEPVAQLDGELKVSASGAGPTRMAFAWVSDLAGVERVSRTLLRGQGACAALEAATTLDEPLAFEPRYPVRFRLTLSSTPPLRAQHPLSSVGGEGALAMGWVFGFQDADADGRFQPGRDVRLGTLLEGGQLVVFLDGRLPAAPDDGTAPWAGLPPSLGRGFHVLGIPPERADVFTRLADDAPLVLEASPSACR